MSLTKFKEIIFFKEEKSIENNNKKCHLCDQIDENCICLKEWKSFDDDITNIYFNTTNKSKNPENLKVSVITLCFEMSKHLNLKKLYDNIDTNRFHVKLSYNPKSKKSKNKTNNDSFYNQLTMILSVKDNKNRIGKDSTVNCMIFPNGKIKAAGNRTIRSCAQVIVKCIEIFKSTKEVLEDPSNFGLHNARVVMINSNFDSKTCLKQKILKDIINSNYNFSSQNQEKRTENLPVLSATFNPGKYHGVNIKYISKTGNSIAILVFQSGNIIITAAKKTEELKEAYTFINSTIKNHYETVSYEDKFYLLKKNKINRQNKEISEQNLKRFTKIISI